MGRHVAGFNDGAVTSKKRLKTPLKEVPCYVQRVLALPRTAIVGVALLALTSAACLDSSRSVLNRQAEAHRLSADLRVQFGRAADASNRAVMADTDEASRDAAHAAEQALQQADKDIAALHGLLEGLSDHDETVILDRFKARFTQYRALDGEILPLAVENTNIKAQRLAFGPAQDAVTAFRQSIEAAAKTAAPTRAAVADATAARAIADVLDVQVMEARHIAESNETAMSRMESAMTASLTAARTALASLTASLPPASHPSLASAAAALDRLTAANAELIALSRRNSNVRSLALSLGKQRAVTAECDEMLQTLEDALASHHFSATR